MTTLYRWVSDESEAARLQSEGWQPCPRALETCHGVHAMLLRLDAPDESPLASPVETG